MTDVDERPGFDRRSLIKKGLVAGGIVATAPVITTFNAAAFADSVPGCHQLQFLLTGNNNALVVTRQNETAEAGCEPSSGAPTNCTWVATNTQDPDPTFVTPIPISTAGADSATFTLNGDYAGCRFVGATAFGGNPAACAAGGFSALGTNTITFTRLANGQTYVVRLLVFC